MSKLFYDHLIVIEEVEAEIKNIAESPEEREELWQIVDEIIHMRMLELFLNKLAEKHHDEFLEKFYKRPHDESLLGYLKEKINDDVEEFVKKEIKMLEKEILREIRKGN